ncbi:hypothetical protein BH11BAC1_BH11BAC1_08440 [soil metagenome]
MGRPLQFLFSIIFCFFFSPNNINAQCSGGSSGGVIVPGLAWSSTGTTAVPAGTYYTFAAIAGQTYYFSFCGADGGNSSFDTQISLLNNAGVYAGGYNDDFCGLQSYLTWTCLATANYRVLINLYSCQATGANLGTLVYKYAAPLTCPGNLGGGVTNVPSLPYAAGAGTTCGSGNDLTATNTNACGSKLYYTGEDRVYIFTPATTGTVSINLTSSGSYTGLMLYNGCPLLAQGGTCVDYAQSSTGNKTLNVCLQAGITYYLVLDSWSTPSCNAFSNLTISAPIAAGGCATGTGTVAVASLPYSSVNRTTCGRADDITATNSVTCGSTSYTTAEDEVFVFTPAASGTSTITVSSLSTWVGITLFQGCPLVSSCSGVPGACIGYSQSSDGNQSLCANLTAGQTYYLVVDQFATPTCIPSYNINISAPSGVSPGITCGNPYPVPALPFSIAGETTACFGNDYTNLSFGSCGSFYESGEDKVYRYIATGSECIGITLSGTSTNSIGYQVYQGCPGTGGTVCIANNGGATSGTLTGSAVLPAAGTYYIIVDTWAAPANAVYNINIVSYGGGPANDLPCGAIALAQGVYAQGNNNCSGNSGEPAPPACWVTPNTINSVWYSVTTTAAQTQLRIRTSPGSLTNSQIAVYTGACGAGMTYVACNDDAPACGSTLNYNSELILTVSPSTTYYIVVDGYSNFTGSFGIMVLDPATQSIPPAYGQECATPNPVCNSTISVGDPGWQAFGNICDFPGGGGNCLLSGERGSAFYQINIGANGTLVFDIIPNDWPGAPSTLSTDYDFALWKTGGAGATTCAAIAGGAAPVRCNYSFLGVTGIYTTAGTSPGTYPGFGAAYDANINVVAGDVYLLEVSNFSNSTSGFTMNFGASPINYTPSSGSVTWSGGISTDWTQAPNWGGCAIPTCSIDAIVVPSTVNQPVITSNQTVKNLVISAGATLTINPGVVISICGDYTNNGSLIASPTSTIQFINPSVVQNINGSLTGANRFPNLVINKAGGSVMLNQNIDIAGSFTTSNGTSIFNTTGKNIKLAGNFNNNNGNTTFSNVGTGTLEFNGTAAQTFTNSNGAITLYNVLMNHTGSGVTLSGANSTMNISASGSLTLTLGKIITGATLEVNDQNTAAGSVTPGNINSYVEGRLRRAIGTSAVAYDFPVGNSAMGYERANISYTTAPGSGYNLLAFFTSWGAVPNGPVSNECPTNNYGLFPAFNHGFWTIDASVGAPTGTYTTSLYNRSYTNNVGLAWTVMKRTPSGGGAWALNGLCSGASTAATTIRTSMSNFSDFATVQYGNPLPIELISFTAEMKHAGVISKWTTSVEINNDYFEVERSKSDFSFEPIGRVKGSGNSNALLNYELYDPYPTTGTNYYRLKQVDYNGHYTYSEVVAIKIEKGTNDISLYPNPAKDELHIDFNSFFDGVIDVMIEDAVGQTNLSLKQNVKRGLNSINININQLADGVYYLKLRYPNENATKQARFMKGVNQD